MYLLISPAKSVLLCVPAYLSISSSVSVCMFVRVYVCDCQSISLTSPTISQLSIDVIFKLFKILDVK